MAKIVTVINFKGGVGKTVISIETAAALARFYGKRTLLVDLDPQASATFYVMEQPKWKEWKDENGSTYDIFNQQQRSFSIQRAIVRDVVQGKATVIGFDLLPSNPDLVDVDLGLTEFRGHNILQYHFDQIYHEYDYIICDCPPTFNPITKNALWASHAYVVPTVPDFLSTYGIALLQRSVHKLFAATNHTTAFTGPVLGGVILTRFNGTATHQWYRDQVRFDYKGKVFDQIISNSINVASAADEHTPISALSPKNPASKLQPEFQSLAREFISRIDHLRP
jgi:chromosome partitioning protein